MIIKLTFNRHSALSAPNDIFHLFLIRFIIKRKHVTCVGIVVSQLMPIRDAVNYSRKLLQLWTRRILLLTIVCCSTSAQTSRHF